MDFCLTQYCWNYLLDIVCDGSVVIRLYMHFAADGFATPWKWDSYRLFDVCFFFWWDCCGICQSFQWSDGQKGLGAGYAMRSTEGNVCKGLGPCTICIANVEVRSSAPCVVLEWGWVFFSCELQQALLGHYFRM